MVRLNNHQKAAQRTKAAKGEDFFQRIGAMGGAKSRGGGFIAGSEATRAAGRKGGAARWPKTRKRASLPAQNK